MYNEKSLTAAFSKWLRKNRWDSNMTKTMAIEFKICKKRRLNFNSDFQPHQLMMLDEASKGCVYHKISDASPGSKPFDSFQICHADSYVGVMWYVPRKEKKLYMIKIKDILTVSAKQKSITRTDARDLATKIIKL